MYDHTIEILLSDPLYRLTSDGTMDVIEKTYPEEFTVQDLFKTLTDEHLCHIKLRVDGNRLSRTCDDALLNVTTYPRTVVFQLLPYKYRFALPGHDHVFKTRLDSSTTVADVKRGLFFRPNSLERQIDLKPLPFAGIPLPPERLSLILNTERLADDKTIITLGIDDRTNAAINVELSDREYRFRNESKNWSQTFPFDATFESAWPIFSSQFPDCEPDDITFRTPDGSELNCGPTPLRDHYVFGAVITIMKEPKYRFSIRSSSHHQTVAVFRNFGAIRKTRLVLNSMLLWDGLPSMFQVLTSDSPPFSMFLVRDARIERVA
jgi:hypothetical protein